MFVEAGKHADKADVPEGRRGEKGGWAGGAKQGADTLSQFIWKIGVQLTEKTGGTKNKRLLHNDENFQVLRQSSTPT